MGMYIHMFLTRQLVKTMAIKNGHDSTPRRLYLQYAQARAEWRRANLKLSRVETKQSRSLKHEHKNARKACLILHTHAR